MKRETPILMSFFVVWDSDRVSFNLRHLSQPPCPLPHLMMYAVFLNDSSLDSVVLSFVMLWKFCILIRKAFLCPREYRLVVERGMRQHP